MLIGHLPAGYLLARGVGTKFPVRALFLGVLAGSILPDFDMLWFLFVDHGTVHHHEYLTHRPILWAGVLVVGMLLRHVFLLGAGIGGLFHMALDSVAGAISWGWPFVTEATTLVIVPATQSHWVLSFLTHWTFAVELTITAVAAILAWRANVRG